MLDSITVLIVVGLVGLCAWQEYRILRIRNAVARDVRAFAELARQARADFLANQEQARASTLALERVYTTAEAGLRDMAATLTTEAAEIARREQALLRLHDAAAGGMRQLADERNRLEAAATECRRIGAVVVARGQEVADTAARTQGELREAIARTIAMQDRATERIRQLFTAAGVDLGREQSGQTDTPGGGDHRG